MMKNLKSNKGFTLMELVVVIVVLGVLSTVVVGGIGSFLRSMEFVSQNIALMHDINNVTANFFYDATNISLDASSEPQISTFTDMSFAFTRNDGQNITYTITGNELQRDGDNLLFTALDNANTTFSYFGYVGGVRVDAIAGGLAANDIRLVTLDFTITKGTFTRNITQTFSLNYR